MLKLVDCATFITITLEIFRVRRIINYYFLVYVFLRLQNYLADWREKRTVFFFFCNIPTRFRKLLFDVTWTSWENRANIRESILADE